MKNYFYSLLLFGFILLILTGTSQAQITPWHIERFTGRLNAVTKLSDRYKLRVEKRVMFIMINQNDNSGNLIKMAKSLLHKRVTVFYNKANNLIVSITSPEKKTPY